MERKRGAWRSGLACTLALVCALCASVVAMRGKAGWHIDEVATLGLANGSQNGYITAYDDQKFGRGAFLRDALLGDSLGEMLENGRELIGEVLEKGLSGVNIRERYLAYREQSAPVWKTGEEFLAFLSAEEGFSLRDVYINQLLDTHPPLYYLFVRAAYSIYAAFEGASFSLWPAYFVNLAFLLACCAMLMRIGKKRFGSLSLGIGSALLYALSCAGLGISICLRMYVALTFFALWCVDCHLEWAQRDWRFSRGLGWRLIASVALGFLTHYYFAIFAVCMAAACGVSLLVKRRFGVLLRYIGRMASAALLSLVVWPFSAAHILFSNRSAEALGSLSQGGLFARIASGWRLFAGLLFGDALWIPLALLLLFGVGLFLQKRSGQKEDGMPWIWYAVVPSAMYLLIVFAISPYEDLRYMSCALPGFALFAAVCVRAFVKAFSTRKAVRAGLTAGACVALALLSAVSQTPPYLYSSASADKAFVSRMEGLPCVYVASTGASFYREMPDFRYYDRVLIVNESELPLLMDDETLAGAEEIVLYIHDSYSQTDTMKTVLANSPFTEYEVLIASSPSLDARAYVLSK